MRYGRLKKNIFYKSLRDIKQEGFLFFIIKTYRFFKNKIFNLFANNIVIRLRKKPVDFFEFNGKRLEYLIHPYNLTWTNERTIEIPIALDYIKNLKTNKILEVGAVLKHYTDVKWEVVDKFELGEGIINEDIIDFNPKKKYDLIVCISTLEHIGFDDEDDKEKIVKAVEGMKKCLNKKGIIIATMPLGYNKYMDERIFSKTLGFNEMYFLKKISRKNKWKQVSMEEIKNAKYNYPYNNANAVVIGVWKNN